MGRKLLMGIGKKTAVLGIILGIMGVACSFSMFALSESTFAGLLERITIYPTIIWNFIFGARILFGSEYQSIQ